MLNRRTGVTAWLLALTLLRGSEALAQPVASPRSWLQTRQVAITRILQGAGAPNPPGPPPRQVARIIDGMFDLDDLARRMLGPYWDPRTPQERRTFAALLRQLIDRNYERRLSDLLGYDLRYTFEQVAPGGDALVRVEARPHGDPRAEVTRAECQLQPRGALWVVYDVILNGSSIVHSYRSAYTRIVRERGFAELIDRVRARVRSGDALGP
jgi:phospholipid transport system substrate-binding protein